MKIDITSTEELSIKIKDILNTNSSLSKNDIINKLHECFNICFEIDLDELISKIIDESYEPSEFMTNKVEDKMSQNKNNLKNNEI